MSKQLHVQYDNNPTVFRKKKLFLLVNMAMFGASDMENEYRYNFILKRFIYKVNIPFDFIYIHTDRQA
jgi:hypothetical protein